MNAGKRGSLRSTYQEKGDAIVADDAGRGLDQDDVGILARAILIETDITYSDQPWRMCLSLPIPTKRKRDNQNPLKGASVRKQAIGHSL